MLLRSLSSRPSARLAWLLPMALAVAFSAQSAAAQPESSRSWIEAVSQRAGSILTGPAGSEPQRASQLEKLIAESFDLTALSDFILGRQVHQADSAQLSRYAVAFRGCAMRNFSRLIADLDGRALKVTSSRQFGEQQALVTTRLGSAEVDPLEIVWRVRWHEETPKIIDVFVEGISMALTLRHELSAVARTRGIDALVESLEQGPLMPPSAGHSRDTGGAAHHLLQSALKRGAHIARKPN